MKLFTDLTNRNLIKQATTPELESFLSTPQTCYLGIDPTANSLHTGSLMALITMKRFAEAGHKVLILSGGFTASIGDPSGKSQERKAIDLEVIKANTHAIEESIKKIIPSAELVNNLDWYSKLDLISFFRNIGKHFSVNEMLNKESVKSRLAEREQGISFTEFSYMLLQAYDFTVLAKEQKVSLQVGGSDQWSNIILGASLTRKLLHKEVHGLTFPLLVKSDGTKFGKTESGAIWLDPQKTTPFDFFQFFMKTEDKDVIQFLKWLTFISTDEISVLEISLKNEPEKRLAQTALARAVTQMVHGEAELTKVEEQTLHLFKQKDWTAAEANFNFAKTDILNQPVVELLVKTTLSSSKSAARRDIAGGGIKVGEMKVTDANCLITEADLVDNRLILRKGKSNFKVIQIV